MAYNESLVLRVRELLARMPNVQEKKMFGSIGFMVNDKLCIGVGEHKGFTMMARIGPDKFEEALNEKGVESTIMRGRVMRGYISLTDDAVKSQKALEKWVRMALEFNNHLTQDTPSQG